MFVALVIQHAMRMSRNILSLRPVCLYNMFPVLSTRAHIFLIHSAQTAFETQSDFSPIDPGETERHKDAADLLPSSNVEVQNAWSFTYASPYVLIALHLTL